MLGLKFAVKGGGIALSLQISALITQGSGSWARWLLGSVAARLGWLPSPATSLFRNDFLLRTHVGCS